jgi:G3E family GTPase
MKNIPVYVLTGYLGAGKTTTLNHLLGESYFASRKIALVINEFGKLGVDGKLLRPGGYSSYEINKGSLFCICTKTDFLKTLEAIASDGSTELVIIEATGIAETRDIEAFVLEEHFRGRFSIKANICLVDAVNYTKTAAFLRTVNSQIQWADGIVINKADLVPAGDIERLRAILAGISAVAPVVVADNGNIEMSFIDRLVHRTLPGALAQSPPADIIAVSLQSDLPVNRAAFLETIESLGQRLLRLKGNVAFANGPEFVETVFDRIICKPICKELGHTTAFTAIGWKTTKEELTAAFEKTWL